MAEYSPSKIIKDGNTYNFRDTTKIPLAGSNAISGSLIPATDNAIDIGSSTKNIKMLYTKGASLDGKTIDTDANDNMTFNGHIVDTIKEQGTGYIRYSNGIQICWGQFYISGDTKSFPKSFANDSIALTMTRTGTEYYDGWVSSITASNFTPTSPNTSGFSWRYIAIGKWK